MGVYLEQVIITGDASSYERAMQGATGTTTSATKKWTDSFTKFSGVIKGVLAIQAARYVKDFVVGVVNAASDQNEALNKMREVFGASASSIEAFAQTSADAFGLSKAAAFDMTAAFGNILQVSGMTEDAAATMSVELVKLGADIASFNNLPMDEALDKIRSGLVGEAEPLRTVGVLLSEARVQQEAYASGIARTGATLTEAQKVQARYNLIFSDTSKAHGDFARTSEGMANSGRRLSAMWEDWQAEIGQKLLPVIEELLPQLMDMGEIAIPLLIGVVEEVVEAITLFVDAATQLSAALGGDFEPLLEGFGDNLRSAAKWGSFLNPVLRGLNDGFGAQEAAVESAQRKLEEHIATAETADRVFDNYSGTTEEAAGATRDLADAHEEAAEMSRDQWLAERQLAGGLLGLIATLKAANDAQREVDTLRHQGKEGTREFNDAVLAATEAQLDAKVTLAEYRKELRESGATQAEVKERLKALAGQMGITAEEIKDAIGPLGKWADGLERVNRLPRNFQFTITTEYVTHGQAGGAGQQFADNPSFVASGGIVRAARGMVARSPTLLVGEGNYPTFAGRGAEAIVPLDERGISILAEAVRRGTAGAQRGGQTIVVAVDGYEIARALHRYETRRGGL